MHAEEATCRLGSGWRLTVRSAQPFLNVVKVGVAGLVPAGVSPAEVGDEFLGVVGADEHVGAVVGGAGVPAGVLDKLVALPFGHAPEPVLSDFHVLIHTPKHTPNDAWWYTGNMTEDNLALPIELLGSIERYAVYRCYSDQGQLLYVGETGDLGKRLADHAGKLWFVQVRGITLEWYADELEALKAERRAIHVEHPKYNVVHRNTPRLAQPAARSQRPSRRGTKMTTEERAANLLDADPALRGPRMGGELARRLGVSPATGRRMHAKLAAQDKAPVPADGQEA